MYSVGIGSMTNRYVRLSNSYLTEKCNLCSVHCPGYTIKDLCLFGILRTFVFGLLFSLLPIDAYPEIENECKTIEQIRWYFEEYWEKTILFFRFGYGIKSSGLCFSFVVLSLHSSETDSLSWNILLLKFFSPRCFGQLSCIFVENS